MMVELRNLNSFFKAGLENPDQSVAVPSNANNMPEPPSLIISNSHCAIPISLESSENISAPLSLAVRRGKDHLPPLLLKTIKYDSLVTEYPSIPTAFLGSPSAYSPKFEYANTADDPSLDLEDMIASLRAQCASMYSNSERLAHRSEDFFDTPDLSKDTWSQASNDSDDAGELAFANSFLPNLDINTTDAANKRAHPIGACTRAPKMNIQPTSAGAIRSPPQGPPPSTPPPPLPSPSGLSSTHKVRGILKNSKNVRFASLPDTGSKVVENVETPASRRRQSVALVPVDRPRTSRLRPKSNTVTGSTPPLVLPRAHGITTSAAIGTSGGRPMSVPAFHHSDGCRPRGSITPTQPRTPLASVSHQSAIPAQKKHAPVSLGRHSLGRVITVDIKKEPDDAKSRGSTPVLSRRWTNENNFRRGSDANQVTPKSRMPVPLRNILTRFK